MTQRDEIVAEARSWLGTRFHHQAERKGLGVDCIGVIVGTARARCIDGVSEYDACIEARGYGKSPDPEMAGAVADRLLVRIAKEVVTLGDIFWMRFSEDPQHFALVSSVNPWRIIHAYAQARRVVEHGLDDLWRLRIVRAYRYRGIA